MTSIWKRSLSMFLALVMVFGMVPVTAFATDGEEIVEEVLVEEIVEEEIVEEVFEEEVVEEEIIEEIVEEIVEEEIIVEEEVAPEAEVQEEVIELHVSDEVAMTDAEALAGDIWVNKHKQAEEISELLMGNKIKDAILTAVYGENYDDSAVVTYDGMDVTGAGYEAEAEVAELTPAEYFAMQKGMALKDEVSTSNENKAVFAINGIPCTITFKDSRMSFEVSFGAEEVANKGALTQAEVEQKIKDMIVVTGTSPVDGSTTTAVLGTDYTVSFDYGDEFSWPEPADEECYVEVVVTMTNEEQFDLDNGRKDYCDFRLNDTRGTYTVKFVTYFAHDNGQKNPASEVEYLIVEGEKMPAYTPAAVEYYTLGAWRDKEGNAPAETVTTDVTYTAIWSPETDVNGNGEADQDEYYYVVFKNEKGEVVKDTERVEWGTDFSTLEPSAEALKREGFNFAGWTPVVPDKVVAPGKYSNTWTFTGAWTADHVVTFISPLTGKVDHTVKVTNNDESKVAAPTKTWEGVYVTGWKIQGQTDAYDFDTVVTGNLTLEPICYADRNGNTIEDGTDGDLYSYHVWTVDGVEVEHLDWLAGEKEITVADYTYVEKAGDGKTFTGWAEGAYDEDTRTTTYAAILADDTNNNEVDDAKETVTVSIEGDGTVTIDGETAEGEHVYDSTKNVNVIKAIPEDTSYVASIVLDGEGQTPDFEDHAASVMLNGAKNVVVTFSDAGFVMHETIDMDTHSGGYTVEEVYGEIVAAPAYNENVTVQYLARKAGTVEVDVSDLPQIIRTRIKDEEILAEIDAMYAEHVGEDGIYEYTYTEAWESVDADVKDKEITAQQVANGWMEDIETKPLRELANLSMVDLEESIEASGYHAFGTNTQEILNITYADDKQSLVAEGVEMTMMESRTGTYIKVSNKTYTYGAFTDAQLIADAVVYDENNNVVDANVSILGGESYAGKNVGKYTVTLVCEDGEDYTGSTAEFTLIINKAKPSVSVPESLVLNVCEGYEAEAAPKADVDVIHMIAGVDIDSVDIKLENGSIGTVTAKTWIEMPQSILDLLEEAKNQGYEIELEDRVYKLSEIKKMLTVDYADALEMAGVGGAIDGIVAKLDQVQDLIATVNQPDPDVEVTFVDEAGESVYPKNYGIYVNVAVAVDTNYTNEQAMGMLVLHPGAALPNKGIELIDSQGNGGNVFTFITDGTAKALTVKDHEDCKVEYYGFTNSADIYANGAPTDSGLYVASAVYTDAEGNIATDSAIVIMAQGTTTIDVSGDVIAEDGSIHKPEVTVGASDAAYTLISAEADLGNGLVSVNIDFPAGINKVLDRLNMTLPEDITLGEAVTWLNKIPAAIEAKIPVDLLQKFGVSYDDTIKPAVDKAASAIVKVSNEITALADKYGADVKVTFDDHTGYSKAGVYYYIGIVTDPDYLPAVDPGYLVIENSQFKMEDKTVTYNGAAHLLEPANNAGRGYLTIIKDQSGLNLILDSDDEQALLDKIEARFDMELEGKTVTVAQLREKANDVADELASAITEYIREKATAKINGYTKVEEMRDLALDIMDERLPQIKDYIKGKLNAIIDDYDSKSLTINGTQPTEVGTYEFHAISYAVAYDSATLTIEEVENPYEFGQSMQIWLLEPWALRANLYITHVNEDGSLGADLTESEIEENIEDYGVYFVRESDLEEALQLEDATQTNVTNEDIIENSNVILYTKDSGKIWYEDAIGGLSCDFDEGIYTYELSDAVFVLYYVVIDGETYYAPIRERSISEFVNEYKDDEKTFPDALERDLFAKLAQMEADIVKYRGQWTNPQPLPIMDAPTIANYAMGTPAEHGISFAHTRAVVLIEPWGLQFNGYIPADKEYADYGVVVYYDTEGKYAAQPTVEELLDETEAHVFSVSNGDAEHAVENKEHKITAVYNNGVYTYQMTKNAYVMFYVKDGDNYYYGPVKTRTIQTSIESVLETDISNLQENVLNSMTALYESVKAFRASKGYYDV